MYIPFILSQMRAEFAVFSPRVAEKGNSNVLAHVSSSLRSFPNLSFYGSLKIRWCGFNVKATEAPTFSGEIRPTLVVQISFSP